MLFRQTGPCGPLVRITNPERIIQNIINSIEGPNPCIPSKPCKPCKAMSECSGKVARLLLDQKVFLKINFKNPKKKIEDSNVNNFVDSIQALKVFNIILSTNQKTMSCVPMTITTCADKIFQYLCDSTKRFTNL